MNTPESSKSNETPTPLVTRKMLIPLALTIASTVAVIAIANHAHAVDKPDASHAQDSHEGSIRQEGGEYWKNSSQTFLLDADGQFNIDSLNGRIEVHGWNNNMVMLVTAIHGKTRESVEAVKVNIDSSSRHMTVHTEQESEDGKQNNAAVDYIVQVPEHALLKNVSSVNGGILIDGMAGDILASTVNGQAQIKGACRNLKLETVNGTITAEMNLLSGGQSVSCNTVNGRIKLALPENADANFAISTLNGGISSEFPSLQPEKEFPVGNKLKGSLGKGSARVKGETVNGGVEILKRVPETPASNPAPASTPPK